MLLQTIGIECKLSTLFVICLLILDCEIISRTAGRMTHYYLGFPFLLKKLIFEEWESRSFIPMWVLKLKNDTTKDLLLANSHWPGQKPKCLPILKIFLKCVNFYVKAKHICVVNQFSFLKKSDIN